MSSVKNINGYSLAASIFFLFMGKTGEYASHCMDI